MMSIPYYFNKIDNYSFFSLSLTIITLVSLFWALYAGSIIDGFNRKDVFLGTNFIGGIVILSIASILSGIGSKQNFEHAFLCRAVERFRRFA